MKKLTYFLILIPFISTAQLNENFESGTLTGWQESSNGRWGVSSIDPISGIYSLQHIFDNPLSDHDQISYPVYNIALDSTTTTWRFKVKYGYTPSGSNNWGIFLISDQNSSQMYPSGTANGYLLGVNYSGADDLLKLWKISSGSASELLNSGFNWQDNVSASEAIGMQVTRSSTGLWEVMIDTTGGYNNFYSVGSSSSSVFTQFNHFGIYYEYSSSQDRKLWLDDIFIDGFIIIDTLKPEVKQIKVISSNRVEVIFSEPIDFQTATNTLNYTIDGSIGNPISAILVEPDIVDITVEADFLEDNVYLLTVVNIEDLFHNSMNSQSLGFSYYLINPYDVLINELMVDPTPSIELPEQEYIELFNSTTHPVYIHGWSLQVGSSIKPLNGIDLPGMSYIILCSDAVTDEFGLYGSVKGISVFPTLVNTGQSITIRNENDVILSSVTYSDDWYRDDYKADGGWSLEQIDPNNPCGNGKNWMASHDLKGGTPGYQNSVFGENPDFEGPLLLNAYILSDTSLFLYFNEPYDSASALKPDQYIVDNHIGNPERIGLIAPSYLSLVLYFEEQFQESNTYEVAIGGQFTDCMGNTIGSLSSRRFGYPEKIDSLDIIINEVLFNPFMDGVDFVEVYNRSSKILDFSELKLASREDQTGIIKNVYPITNYPFLFFPEEYIVFSSSTVKVLEQYYSPNPFGFLDLQKMPSYPNDQGRVVLTDQWLNVIDEFWYSEEMHFPLLRIVEGVSLERVSLMGATQDNKNWHSASEDCGFGTPSYENSQHVEDHEPGKNKIKIVPEVFSPNNDGYHDVVQLYYEFDQPGYVANITIFDARGRIVRKLVNNELLGMEGSFTWNGLNDSNSIPVMGIYLFFIEIYDLKGNVSHYKRTCVLAKKIKP